MTFEAIAKQVEQHMSAKRFRHTLGVVKASEELAKLYGADVERARLAALLHDYGKEVPLQDMQALVTGAGYTLQDEVYHNGSLLHGLVGAILSERDFGITDEEVLEAVRVHTVGKVDMSILDKVVFLADYIEENRDFPGVEELREVATQDLEAGVLAGYDCTIRHLLERTLPIYHETLLGRNSIIRELQQRKR